MLNSFIIALYIVSILNIGYAFTRPQWDNPRGRARYILQFFASLILFIITTAFMMSHISLWFGVLIIPVVPIVTLAIVFAFITTIVDMLFVQKKKTESN
ncbi:hypothetical protein CVD28_02535 [Bacillus sp. M6-12]|uniref:hypothetical protein n=1 Tax=Bacillus sp. M6-12 TaxID=2054166 RepID=UPI000C7662F9|nr:hypothetical protein [Bacillus sp. M6-12]PLS19309.1 hypothetical protein CVD28_02535 [Bacillus sp. M6-12]